MSRHFSHVCFQPSARSQQFLTLWFLCWKKRRVFEGNLFRSYGIFCGQCWNPSGAGHKKSSHTHDHLFVRMYKCVDVHEASCCCCCWRSCRWNHLCCTGTIDLKRLHVGQSDSCGVCWRETDRMFVDGSLFWEEGKGRLGSVDRQVLLGWITLGPLFPPAPKTKVCKAGNISFLLLCVGGHLPVIAILTVCECVWVCVLVLDTWCMYKKKGGGGGGTKQSSHSPGNFLLHTHTHTTPLFLSCQLTLVVLLVSKKMKLKVNLSLPQSKFCWK